jgi:hypothetical protein
MDNTTDTGATTFFLAGAVSAASTINLLNTQKTTFGLFTRFPDRIPFLTSCNRNRWHLVRKRSITTERPPLPGDVSAKFCG